MNKPVKETKTNQVYPSALAAAKALGLDQSNVTKNCKGKLKTVKGYVFEYFNAANENSTAIAQDCNKQIEDCSKQT